MKRKSNKEQPKKKASSGALQDFRYQEIAQQLRNEILEGKFEPGQRFYSLRQIIRDTQRSLPTVRSAINMLIKEKLLVARPGSGYFVTRQTGEHRDDTITRILVVIPSYVSETEPAFTSQIVSGMIRSAENTHAMVSFYRRTTTVPVRYNKEAAKRDLNFILASAPDAVAWLHAFHQDTFILKELHARDIPIVATIRKLPELDLPLLREDNLVYASMMLSHYQALGHRRIGLITRESENDEYFSSKVEAIRKVAASLNMEVDESDFLFLKTFDLLDFKEDIVALEEFLKKRKDLYGLHILAPNGIHPVIALMKSSSMKDRMKSLSLSLNMLDGLTTPTLPTGESLAIISPPLEELGEEMVKVLMAKASDKPAAMSPPLIPIFHPGESMKPPGG